MGQETEKGCKWAGLYGGGGVGVVVMFIKSFLPYHFLGYYFITKPPHTRKTVERHPEMALFPDRLTHGEPVDDCRRLAGFL